MIESLITPWRLKSYSVAVLFGIFLALLIVLSSGKGAEIISGRLGGDFPAFYAAGRIVASGNISELYDIDQQIDQQRDLYPDFKGFLPFPYPPFVALAYAPLSFLPYRMAFVLNLTINIAGLIISLFFLKKMFNRLNEFLLPVLTLSITFYPFLRAILNGQNTAVTFMLISFVWLFSTENRKILAGLCMGLLLYKPQFAIPLIGLFILSGRLRIAFIALLTGFLIIALSSFFTGFQAYEQWYNFLKWFPNADALVNGHNATSWIGFLVTIFGTESKMSFVLGAFFCILTILIIATIWLAGGTKSDFNAQIALAVLSLILIPPHLMFYDIGLLVLAYAVVLQKINRRKIELVLLLWFFGFTQIFSKWIGFSPLFFLVVFSFILSLKLLAVPATRKATEQS